MAAKYTPQQYVDLEGQYCPACGSGDVTGADVDITNGTATQDVSCDECEATWTDLYLLNKYRSLEDGDGNPIA